MAIYDFTDYKEFFNDWVAKQPKKGHGEYRRVAEALRVSTTMVSQVFKGEKHLSLEMACELCEYLNLTEEETEYFLLLVDFSRAGTFKLKQKMQKQMQKRQEKARQLENRIKKDFQLSDEAKAVFYSSWIYSGVRLLTAVEGYQDTASISQRLNLPKNQVQKVIEFLLDHQLCEMQKDKLIATNVATHIGSSDLLVSKHHQNWRLQGLQKMVTKQENDLFFTFPCALSQKDSEKVRALLLEWITELRKIVAPSESESVRCLNIDWFEY